MTAPTQCPAFGLCLPVRYVSSRDADTHVVRLRHSRYEWAVRLKDTWVYETNRGTPEEREIARRASVFAEDVLSGADTGDLRLFIPPPNDFEKDSLNLLKMFTFDRVLGYLYVGPSMTLNRMLVNAGLASTTKGGELGR